MMSIHSMFRNLIAAAILISISFAPARADYQAYTGGHGDIGVKYQDSQLQFRYDFGTTATVGGAPIGSGPDQFSPDEIAVTAGLPAWRELTAGETSIFPAGTTHAYVFGATSSATSPYLGLAAMDPTLTSSQWVKPIPGLSWSTVLGHIDYEIVGMNYQGDAVDPGFALFTTALNGTANPIFSSAAGISNQAFMPIPGHGHYSWGFSDAGVYDISIKGWGTHVTDGYKETYTTMRFVMTPVPEPSSVALTGMGILGIGAFSRYRRVRVATAD